ncbi:MAG: CBM9 family sugar-binding protein [Treponema sp.]|jgi:hypothetical protein|nr:CBM9 family sugar-binding protein [Treponema sp.]
MKRTFLWAGLALVLLIPACQNPVDDGGGSRATNDAGGGSGLYVLPYSPYDYQVLESRFTDSTITVNGDLSEGIWSQAASSEIKNYKHGTNSEDVSSGATGTVKSVWDGYTLYIAVDVTDTTPANLTLLENNGQGGTPYIDPTVTPKSNGAYAIMEVMDWTTYLTPPYNGRFDNVEFAIDFWNDKQDKWADDDGLFAISRSGKLVYDSSGGFGDEGTYASVFASPGAREYNDRIKAYAVTEKPGGSGYTVELALQIYGAKPANGTGFGVDVMISDSPANNTARTSRTYWSHKDNAYRFSSRDGNLDWGAIVLTGHPNDQDPSDFKKSDWMLTNAIRWVDVNLPGTDGYAGTGTSVAANWSTGTWTALNNAVKTGRGLLTVGGHVADSVPQEEIKTKAQAIEAAIASLIAADDPLGATAMNYPITNTLPDPLVFKTDLVSGKKPGDVVASATDWEKRAEEIRLLASIYEYGPKPGTPQVKVTKVSGAPGFGSHWEPAPWYYPNRPPMQVASSPASYAIESTISYAGTEASVPEGVTPLAGSANITFNLYKPGAERKTPVILNFDGNQAEFTDNGIAVLAVPNIVTSDDRATPWDPVRAGTFRQFYPYRARGQRYEISNEMGAAWGASRAIDALVAAKNVQITSKSLDITITGGATDESTFTLKDRITFDPPPDPTMWWMPDTRAWWQVGKLAGADTVQVQQGAGKAEMMYLQAGSPMPSQAVGTYTLTSTAIQHQNEQGVWVDVTDRGTVSVTLVVGAETASTDILGDFIDETRVSVTGYSINGKYAFVSALYDERIKVAIPGASGASGPQTWRYNPAGTVYSAGYGNLAGGELIGDHVMKNPGRSTEIFRRFLTHFNYYERLRGIDANGDFSHGYAQRLPYDGHELVASMWPRAVIERAVMNDFNDGSEQDAIALQGARIVYRKLAELDTGKTTPGGTSVTKAGIDDLLVFNYHVWAPVGDPHGAVSGYQRANESTYMNWYFNGGGTPSYLTATELYPWNRDPFFEDVLVTGGSNSYERHYGGFPVMMPWPWAGPYYPAKQ